MFAILVYLDMYGDIYISEVSPLFGVKRDLVSKMLPPLVILCSKDRLYCEK